MTTVSLLYAALALVATALVIYGAFFGAITALLLRSLFFSAVASAGLMAAALKLRSPVLRAVLYGLALFALLPGPYLYHSYLDIIMRGAIATQFDEIMFLGVLLVVLVLVRRYLGWSLLLLSLIALVYAYYGYLIPGKYGHGGYDISRLASTLFLSTEGFYGVPMGVAVEYIFLFALLGTVLMKMGTGEVFVDIARGLTGRVQGGAGLSATLASAMLGTINGSAVANVVTTGTFTIPLMRRTGFSAKTAGAIEAASSSAGQILPPIMGAAAFLMAEIVGVPYAQIALAGLVPGLLYVLALMISVRLEAGRLNLDRDTSGGLRFLGETLKARGYLLLPLIGLIGLMIAGMTPTRAAVYCLVFALLLSPWRKETRVNLVDLVAICRSTMLSVMPIVAAVAAAGVVIGVLNLTGMGLMVSSLIIEVGGTNLWLVLVLTALAAFVLGMGLPTSAAYLLLAVLVAPALIRLGIDPIVAHMFIFYFGLVSAITPPVALAAYAAASISGADANATAVESIRLGFVKLLVPFLFVTMPGLLMRDGALQIWLAIPIATVGLAGLSVAFAGWFVRPMSWIDRAAFALGSILVLWPAPVDAFDIVTLAARLGGLAILVICTVRLMAGGYQAAPEAARS
ncbi:TRAP transporter fused permease subunit [Aquamicrobium sp. LC103]|uniref:TRAP transporter permease n=1 Tax=Aquamicrobium sp. LC103 TaxID=1120658 RepID=UPI0019807935|nr:TRAP transporter fused permease subunit [Aquamicrobium sp. LC103]